MSGPLRMTAHQADALGRFLAFLTKATLETGCQLAPYSPAQIQLPDVVQDGQNWSCLEFVWDNDIAEYRVDDQVGS